MIFECSWRRAGAKGKVTAEKVKAASSSKLQDRFKISKLLQVETYLFRTSSNFLSALKTAKVLFQQVSKQGILIVSRQPYEGHQQFTFSSLGIYNIYIYIIYIYIYIYLLILINYFAVLGLSRFKEFNRRQDIKNSYDIQFYAKFLQQQLDDVD